MTNIKTEGIFDVTLSGIIKKSTTPLTRKELFSKYKFNHDILFETGTHKGESVQTALELGFNKVLSVELLSSWYKQCCSLFEQEINNNKVYLYQGDSGKHMEEMLSHVDKPSLFWLDAHVDGKNGDPLWPELEAIKNHHIKTHTIIVDDIPLYFSGGAEVKNKILEINPNYQFIIEDALNEGNGNTMSNWDLVAYLLPDND